jgi:hypothetical protein
MPNINQTKIRELATTELAKAGGDAIVATKAMADLVKADDVLYRQLMDPLVRNECYKEVRAVCKRMGRAVYEMPQPSAEKQRADLEILGRGTLSMMAQKLAKRRKGRGPKSPTKVARKVGPPI